MMLRWMRGPVAVAAMLSALPAMAESLLDKVAARGEIVAGIELQSAPLEFTEGRTPKGYSIDLMALVAEDMGVKVRYIDIPFPSLLPGLDASKFDMSASSVTVTKARVDRYAYSLPIAEGTVGLIARANDESVKASKDVAGKTVGAGKGSSMLRLLQEYGATLPGGLQGINEYVDSNQSYADLANGRISAVANPMPNILYLQQVRGDTFKVIQPPFGPRAYLGWMVRKDAESKPLMDRINVALVKLNASGKMRELQMKWFGLAMELPTDRVPDPLY